MLSTLRCCLVSLDGNDANEPYIGDFFKFDRGRSTLLISPGAPFFHDALADVPLIEESRNEISYYWTKLNLPELIKLKIEQKL